MATMEEAKTAMASSLLIAHTAIRRGCTKWPANMSVVAVVDCTARYCQGRTSNHQNFWE